jgi:hypothetical protein
MRRAALLLAAALLLPAALAVPASASAASAATDCHTIAYTPWRSTTTNRVYFSGGVSCNAPTYPSRINLETLWYWGSASAQNYHGQKDNACSNSLSCWTPAGSYASYAGYQYYCTVVYGGVVAGTLTNLQPTKACAWV